MVINTQAASLVGADAAWVGVEVDLLRRLPAVAIVGLPSASIRESTERVRSAILAAGFEFPRQRVVVSLAPADLRKDGTAFDLPMAVGILAASKVFDPTRIASTLLVGELSLSGDVRGVRGVLAYACLAKARGLAELIVPAANEAEAALVEGLNTRVARTLAEVVAHFAGQAELPRARSEAPHPGNGGADLRDVRGQEPARLALEIAAAGGHNLLMEGPPGCGKSMLAARLPGILPSMTREEALVCTRIHSAAGLPLPGSGILSARPFRAPHHSVSLAGMIGNAALRPGEASLAHQGVLFLDEFPEFPRHVRETLRAPLETREVVLARAGGNVVFPASFMLVAAANPCPCGFFGHPTRPCTCTVPRRDQYRARLSGPLADRLDLRVELEPVPPETLLTGRESESSAEVRQRVEEARRRQYLRAGRAMSNAELPGEGLPKAVLATTAALHLLQDWMERTSQSARVGSRVLKVARTVADLDGAAKVEPAHIHRAVSLRCEVDDGEAR